MELTSQEPVLTSYFEKTVDRAEARGDYENHPLLGLISKLDLLFAKSMTDEAVVVYQN